MNPTWWNEVTPVWGAFLVEVALKSTLLILGLLLADRLLGDRRASWRNLLWRAALAGLVLIPLALALLPSLQVPVLDEAEVIVPVAPRDPLALAVAERAGAALPANPPASLPVMAAAAEPQTEAWEWAGILVLIYGVGVCFFLGRLGVGLLYVSSLRRQAEEVRDERLWPALQELRARLGVRRPVQLGTSEQVGSPLQVGVFSPMAILPARLLGRLDEQTFRAVAAHELAHVRRWDYLVHLLAMVVLACHWLNPLAWLAVRRLHETGEHTCDEWAVRLLGRYEVYARALLDVLGEIRGQELRWGLGMAYQAEERLERIMAMKNAIPAGVSRWMGGVVVLVFSAGAVMLGCSALATGNKPPSAAPGSVSPGDTSLDHVADRGTAFAIPLSGITIDGELGDWSPGMATYAIAEVSTAYKPAPPDGPSDFSAHYQVGYDAKANTLYLAVVVEDDELVTRPDAPGVANQDLCEVYIDGDHSGKDRILTSAGFALAGAQQYVMAAGPGVAFDKVHTNPALVGDEQNQSGVKAAFRREGTTTVYEWAIPLYASFPDQPFKAKAGKTIGFDVAVVDADGRENGNWISWSPGFKVLNSDMYGNLALIENYRELGTLAGALADGEHPAARVALEVWRGGQLVASLRTDAQGRYEERLPPGEYTLRVKGAQGFAPDSATATVHAGQQTNPRLALSPMVLPEILRQMAAAYQGLQAYADTTVVELHGLGSGVEPPWMSAMPFAWARPNRFRLENYSPMDSVALVSDGSLLSRYLGSYRQYTQQPAPAVLSVGDLQGQFGLSSWVLFHKLLLSQDPLQALMEGVAEAVEQGREILDGTPVVVVELRQARKAVEGYKGPYDGVVSVRLWIGAQDHLLRQRVCEIDLAAEARSWPAEIQRSMVVRKRVYAERHRAIRVDAEVPAETFTFTPPTDAVLVDDLGSLAVLWGDRFTGKPAPAFALKNLEGQETKLADFAGKVLIVDFLGTLYLPCKIEAPVFIALQSQYEEQGFSVIGLATDEQVQTVRAFAEKNLINYPLLMADEKAKRDYGSIATLPTTFVIDRKGVVRYTHVGAPQDLLVFQKQVEELLGE